MPSEYTGFKTISWEWDEVVCSCAEPTYGREFPEPTDNTFCTTCEKVARWQLLKCKRCNDDYLYNFKHHARFMGKNRDGHEDGWALDQLICWNCICKVDPATKDDRPPVYTEPPRKARSLEELSLGDLVIDFDFN